MSTGLLSCLWKLKTGKKNVSTYEDDGGPIVQLSSGGESSCDNKAKRPAIVISFQRSSQATCGSTCSARIESRSLLFAESPTAALFVRVCAREQLIYVPRTDEQLLFVKPERPRILLFFTCRQNAFTIHTHTPSNTVRFSFLVYYVYIYVQVQADLQFVSRYVFRATRKLLVLFIYWTSV